MKRTHHSHTLVTGAAQLRDRRGLTLIEILIVIALLLVLGGLLIVNFMPQHKDAEIKLQRAQFNEINSALQQFRLNMQRYPTEEEGLVVLWDKTQIGNEEDAARWVGPYVIKPLKDVWNTDLTYHFPGELNPEGYDLISFGPDKQEGTADDINNAGSQGKSADATASTDTGDSTSSGTAGATGGTTSAGTGG